MQGKGTRLSGQLAALTTNRTLNVSSAFPMLDIAKA
jgi:hypothetical protein